MGDAPALMRRRRRCLGVLVAALTVLGLTACSDSANAGAATSSATTAARVAPTSTPGPDGMRTVRIDSGGHIRSFIVDAPKGGSGPRSLVLVYSGVDTRAAQVVTSTDFARVAKTTNQIIVYPQGYDDSWNEGAGNTPAHQAGINDVAFTSAMLRYVEAHYSIDRRRIAAAGISNGALLTELLGCRLASQLTYIVPVEGELPVSVSPGCRPSRPISVLELHGTADTAIPYGGGHFDGLGGGTTVLSAPASARRWATLDHCDTGSPSTANGTDYETSDSTFSTYTGCRSGVSVTLDTIHGGTHAWPYYMDILVSQALQDHPSSRAAAR
jgi:polyhydroxybutyrate depolymerase